MVFNAAMEGWSVQYGAWDQERADRTSKEVERLLKEEEKEEAEGSKGMFGNGLLGGILKRRSGKKRDRRGDAGERATRHRHEKAQRTALESMAPCPAMPVPPRGLYIHGGVGAGKSMTMDSFFAALDLPPQRKKRMHFNRFMTEVHERLHKLNLEADQRKAHALATGEIVDGEPLQEHGVVDPIKRIAEEMSGQRGEVHVLCFDEFQCSDIFTAVTLQRLFTHLLAHGTVIVSTSNRPPEDLNSQLLSGPQAAEFESFLNHLSETCEPWSLDAGVDYRRNSIDPSSDLLPTYLHGPESEQLFQGEFLRRCAACGGGEGSRGEVKPQEVPVAFGRTLLVPEGTEGGVARFRFSELCDSPVGATDFAALAERYHSVFVSSVPQLSITRRNEARRFITLVDELYNHHAVLYCTAEVPMEDLFQGTDSTMGNAQTARELALEQMEALQFEAEAIQGDAKSRRDLQASGAVASVSESQGNYKGSLFTGNEEKFAFDRALSRLMEMQSASYRALRSQNPYQ